MAGNDAAPLGNYLEALKKLDELIVASMHRLGVNHVVPADINVVSLAGSTSVTANLVIEVETNGHISDETIGNVARLLRMFYRIGLVDGHDMCRDGNSLTPFLGEN